MEHALLRCLECASALSQWRCFVNDTAGKRFSGPHEQFVPVAPHVAARPACRAWSQEVCSHGQRLQMRFESTPCRALIYNWRIYIAQSEDLHLSVPHCNSTLLPKLWRSVA